MKRMQITIQMDVPEATVRQHWNQKVMESLEYAVRKLPGHMVYLATEVVPDPSEKDTDTRRQVLS